MAGDAHREREHRGRIISIDGDGARAWNPALAGHGSWCGVHGRHALPSTILEDAADAVL
jgi:hypothetical protein